MDSLVDIPLDDDDDVGDDATSEVAVMARFRFWTGIFFVSWFCTIPKDFYLGYFPI